MSPFALMCVMVLAVQAAAVKTSADDSADLERTISRLGSEVMRTKNASAMLGELEKMAMAGSSTAPGGDVILDIKAILQTFLQSIDESVETARKTNPKGKFDLCTNKATDTTTESKAVDLARAAFKECRKQTTTNTQHNECSKLDNFLTLVSEAVENLPSFPADDAGKVAYVEAATGSAVCKPSTPPIPDQWTACLQEELTNIRTVDANKDLCLTKQTDFEGAVCTWREFLRAQLVHCGSFVTCQTDANAEVKAYNLNVGGPPQWAGWKSNALAVKKIICYLDKWADNTVHTDTTCKDLKLDTTVAATKYEIQPVGTEKPVITSCSVTKEMVAEAKIFPGVEPIGTFENAEYKDEDGLGGKDLEARDAKINKEGQVDARTFVHTITKCDNTNPLPEPAGLLQASDSTSIAAKPIAAEPKREKKLVRREPKKPKASSLAELDSQGRMTNVKVQAQKHSTTELADMDMDGLMELVKSSGANTAAIKAAMTKSIMKLQAQASAV